MLAGEELELAKRGYAKVFFVAFYCPNCGSGRLMVAFLPDSAYIACPACSRAHCNSGVLGVGYSRRELPRFEIWDPPINLTERHFMGLRDIKPKCSRRLTRGQSIGAARS